MSNFWGAHHRVRGWTRLSEATAARYAAPWRTRGDVFPEIVAAGAAALVTGLYLGYVKPVDDGACFRQGVAAWRLGALATGQKERLAISLSTF